MSCRSYSRASFSLLHVRERLPFSRHRTTQRDRLPESLWVAPADAGRHHLEVCISGAYGGYGCGPVDAVGTHGHRAAFAAASTTLCGRRGRTLIIRNVYRMRRDSGSCKVGDSGAPVFRLTGTAMGIAFARSSDGQRCFFSQMANVEYELNVRAYLGGGG